MNNFTQYVGYSICKIYCQQKRQYKNGMSPATVKKLRGRARMNYQVDKK